MLRVMIVDDEPLARQAMRQLLAGHSDVQLIGEANGVHAAIELIQKQKPEALFLDIRMPGASGFDLLNGLDPIPRVVFVTAHSEHAVRAFEVDAVDYLLKPVRPERLSAAISRLKAGRSNHSAIEAAPPLARNDRICLRTPERTIVAPLEQIAAFEAHGDFVKIYLAGESPLLVCQTLAAYQQMIPSPPFLRLSRSLIINSERIDRFESLSRDESRLRLREIATPFRLGRIPAARLRKAIG